LVILPLYYSKITLNNWGNTLNNDSNEAKQKVPKTIIFQWQSDYYIIKAIYFIALNSDWINCPHSFKSDTYKTIKNLSHYRYSGHTTLSIYLSNPHSMNTTAYKLSTQSITTLDLFYHHDSDRNIWKRTEDSLGCLKLILKDRLRWISYKLVYRCDRRPCIGLCLEFIQIKGDRYSFSCSLKAIRLLDNRLCSCQYPEILCLEA